MKRIILLHIGPALVFIFSGLIGFAQTDTLFSKKGEKIPCKITEISEEEIRYLNLEEYDGPVYVISRDKIYKYSLSNGREVMVVPDELSVEHHHSSIMNRRSVIKVHPFSYINQTFNLAYEQVLKVGLSFTAEAGYINNSLSVKNYNSYLPGLNDVPDLRGFFFKPGYKFLVGQDFSLKGMKYAHPLKGRYFSLELVFSYLSYRDVLNGATFNNTTGLYRYELCDVNTYAYGLMINYGRQFILGNIMTLEYYVGIGATNQSVERLNYYNVEEQSPNSYPSGEFPVDPEGIYNYRGFLRSPIVGLSGAFGFRIGYILPSRKENQE